jgi:hypothetical protein
MSERLYSWLLRLFPPDFQERFGEEAMELFRGRLDEEKGLWLRLRLWADLVLDLAISVPREYVRVQPEIPRVAHAGANRGPSFQMIPDGRPRLGAWFLGGALSIVSLAGLSVALAAVSHRPATAPRFPQQRFDPQVSAPSQTAESAQIERWPFDAAERTRIINAAATDMRAHYVDREIGSKVADSLLAQEHNGGYEGVTDPTAFAELVTHQMRNMTADATLTYFRQILSEVIGAPTAEQSAAYRRAMEQTNCTFEPVKILEHNIGYFKLNSFPDPSVCREKAVLAMAALNHADAVIFDLRDNQGGFPAMTALMASYLFDHPEYWYNPRENTMRQSWTQSPVPGNLLADKPVYILTSQVTISGAEQFVYNLKMLKRATIVGERTAGAAHAGAFFRIDDHFGMGIAEVEAINPFSNSNWDGVGVEPDVKVDATDALNTAERLAETKLVR